MTKTIRQSATFAASPHHVYAALMDSRKHARFTNSPARISRQVGGKFTAFGGYIEGTNLALVPDRKIVQVWRASGWPANHYSRATFTLKRVKTGTRLTFTQSGVPARHYTSIKKGWIEHYWTPMKAMLN